MNKDELRQFDGMMPSAIIRRLRDQGYEDIGGGLSSVVFAHPAQPDKVIRMTNFVQEAESFAALCAAHPGNPFLPRIDATHKIDGDPATFVTVMERLENIRHSTDPARAPLTGAARALTLILEGDDAHSLAHEFMMQDKNLRAAVQAIARAVAESIAANGDTFIYYDCGMNRTLPLEQQETDNILYRRTDNGRWQAVFTDPFRSGSMGDENARAGHRAYARALLVRAGMIDDAAPGAADITPPRAAPRTGL